MTLLAPPLRHKARASLTVTAAAGVLALPACQILKATSTAAGRLRIYRSTAARDADAARTVDKDPANGSGLVLETVHTAAALTLSLSPCAFAAPETTGDALPFRWEGPADAALTLEYLPLEA